MTKYELLRLLDAPEVQEMILKIVAEPKKFSTHDADKISKLETELNNLRGENYRLKNELAKAQRCVQNLQRDLDAANDKISGLDSQLNERFSRGWELFRKYQLVGSHARQLLQGVFPREDFMAFICGGAQVDSLGTLWDVLRECVMNRRQQDAQILSEVFEYCLELVNSSKAQASYSILPVNVGERFDSDVHSEAPGSRAQGKISVVYLPGYRNDYNGRIIKKSVVQVN